MYVESKFAWKMMAYLNSRSKPAYAWNYEYCETIMIELRFIIYSGNVRTFARKRETFDLFDYAWF
jgi:hypothetical protein